MAYVERLVMSYDLSNIVSQCEIPFDPYFMAMSLFCRIHLSVVSLETDVVVSGLVALTGDE